MANSALILLAVLVVPTASLVAPCKKHSFLQRGDPADSETIEGDDCGNVGQIVGKWAKSKKVGELAGKAKAAVMGANLASENTAKAVAQAKSLGEKAGLDGKMPVGVKLAAEVAEKAGTAASDAATKLETTADTFGGKFADFAKDISDDDMIKLKKETEEATVASEDAIEAAEKALKKAAEAKAEAMKSSEGALKLIEATLADTTKLGEEAGEVAQKSKHAAGDIDDLVTKSEAAAGKLDDKIADAKEQKPVWEAYKDELKGRETAAADSATAVRDAVDELDTAAKDMADAAKTLADVKNDALSAPNKLLGQSGNLDKAGEEMRKTETKLATLKGKVQTLAKDGKRLADKVAETNKRLK
jgi:chromosome segregation ATPase